MFTWKLVHCISPSSFTFPGSPIVMWSIYINWSLVSWSVCVLIILHVACLQNYSGKSGTINVIDCLLNLPTHMCAFVTLCPASARTIVLAISMDAWIGVNIFNVIEHNELLVCMYKSQNNHIPGNPNSRAQCIVHLSTRYHGVSNVLKEQLYQQLPMHNSKF